VRVENTAAPIVLGSHMRPIGNRSCWRAPNETSNNDRYSSQSSPFDRSRFRVFCPTNNCTLLHTCVTYVNTNNYNTTLLITRCTCCLNYSCVRVCMRSFLLLFDVFFCPQPPQSTTDGSPT